MPRKTDIRSIVSTGILAEKKAGGAKFCPKCKENKPMSDFGSSSKSTDGHRCRCRKCESVASLKYYHNNRSKCAATHQKWVDNNKDSIRLYSKKYHEDHVEEIAEYEKEKLNCPKVKEQYQEYAARYRENNPKKVKAHNAATIALRKGELIKQDCEDCFSDTNIDMHHEDYDKPLDVVWLCRKCHTRRHRDLKELGV